MNNFTKEELQHILWVFNESYKFNDRLMDDIRVKVRSMIDKYCEHHYVIPNFGTLQHCSTCKTLVKGNLIEDTNNHEHDITCRFGSLLDE